MDKKQESELIAKLVAENTALKAKVATGSQLRLKVSEKGCVSMYGLNKQFPVSLYPQQWSRVFGFQGEVEKFIESNRDLLSWK